MQILEAGEILGPYRIEAVLGEGGMGRVYRAIDPSLDRSVALKVIANQGHADQEARFRAEARAAAALSHPNICTIYQVGEAQGVSYIAMELVEGVLLSERISRGPLPARDVARIGAALASALTAAHAKGILHRDIKPANVVLTAGDTPKLLDFGLAKRLWTEQDGRRSSPEAFTTDGTLRGTLVYMSPEQASSQPLDARSDIFSLGIVLYEMACGLRPFTDDTPMNEMIRIVRDQPTPLDSRASELPWELVRCVHKCLEKDPAERYQHAADLAVDLRQLERALQRAPSSSAHLLPARLQAEHPTAALSGLSAVGVRYRRVLPWVLGGLLAGGAVGFLLASFRAPRPAVDRMRDAVMTPLTADAGASESPAISPDGETVAYASDRTGDFEIYLRRASGGGEVNVTNHPSDDVQPTFSPDGRLVAFVSTRSSRKTLTRINPDQEPTGGDLWVIPPLGGEARLVARDANFPVFSPDSRSIYFVGGEERHNQILRVASDGGTPVPVLGQQQAAGEYRRLSVSSDGSWLVLGIAYRGVFLAPTVGGKAVRLDDGARPCFFGPVRGARATIVWTRPDLNLWAREVDLALGRWNSPPERITAGRGWDTDAASDPSGRRLAFTSAALVGAQMLAASLDPKTGRMLGGFTPLLAGDAYDMDPSLSPDGRELVFVSVGRWPGPQRAFRSNLTRGTVAPLSEVPGISESNPLFSPDGKWILFERDSGDGDGAMLLLPREGGQPREVARGAEKSVAHWFPDSRRFLFQSSKDGRAEFLVASIDGGRALPTLAEPYDTMHPAVSPDGRWLAFAGNRDGGFDIFVKPLQGGDVRRLAATPERDGHPFFSRDSRFVYFQPGHQNIWRVPLAGGDPQPVTNQPAHNLYLDAPLLAADGRLLLSRCTFRGNVWIMEGMSGLAGNGAPRASPPR